MHQRTLTPKSFHTPRFIYNRGTSHQRTSTPEHLLHQSRLAPRTREGFYSRRLLQKPFSPPSYYTMGILRARAFHQKTFDCKARSWLQTWCWGWWSSMNIFLLLLRLVVIYGTCSLKEPFATDSGKTHMRNRKIQRLNRILHFSLWTIVTIPAATLQFTSFACALHRQVADS